MNKEEQNIKFRRYHNVDTDVLVSMSDLNQIGSEIPDYIKRSMAKTELNLSFDILVKAINELAERVSKLEDKQNE